MGYRLKRRVILKAIRTTTADVNPSEFTGRRVHERFIKARLWSDDGGREKCVQQFSDVNLVVALRENERRGSTECAGVVLGDSGLLKVKEDDRSDVKSGGYISDPVVCFWLLIQRANLKHLVHQLSPAAHDARLFWFLHVFPPPSPPPPSSILHPPVALYPVLMSQSWPSSDQARAGLIPL